MTTPIDLTADTIDLSSSTVDARRAKAFEKYLQKRKNRKPRQLSATEKAKLEKRMQAKRDKEEKQQEMRKQKEEKRKQQKLEAVFNSTQKLNVEQGTPRFVTELQNAMKTDKLTLSVQCKSKLFAYQKVVAYGVRPGSPLTRLLCVHRTGAGKTLTMIQVLDNFFDDQRPKVVCFPNSNVANNFYRELQSYPNKYRDYVKSVLGERDYEQAELEQVKDILARKGQLGKPGPAPIRAYSFGRLGGTSVFPEKGGEPMDPIFTNTYNAFNNPLSGCIVLIDEVHNLVFSEAVASNLAPKYINLQRALMEMKQGVFVGLTATPMPRGQASGDLLMAIVRGGTYTKALETYASALLLKQDTNEDTRAQLKNTRGKWEGYVSYWYTQPAAQYPDYMPQTCRRVEMTEPLKDNLVKKIGMFLSPPAEAVEEQKKGQKKKKKRQQWARKKNKAQKNPKGVKQAPAAEQPVKKLTAEETKENMLVRAQEFLTKGKIPNAFLFRMQRMGNTFNTNVKLDLVNEYINKEITEEKELSSLSPKLFQIAKAVIKAKKEKSLIIIHRSHGMQLLVAMINRLGACNADNKCFASSLIDLGDNKQQMLETLKQFNSKDNEYGEKIRALVIDAKSYSEGVSFFGVRNLHLANPSSSYSMHLQRLGRVFRSCKLVSTTDERLNRDGVLKTTKKKHSIKVFLWLSVFEDEQMPSPDEIALERLEKGKKQFLRQMEPFKNAAIDKGLYEAFEDKKFIFGQENTCLAPAKDDDDDDTDMMDSDVEDDRSVKKVDKKIESRLFKEIETKIQNVSDEYKDLKNTILKKLQDIKKDQEENRITRGQNLIQKLADLKILFKGFNVLIVRIKLYLNLIDIENFSEELKEARKKDLNHFKLRKLKKAKGKPARPPLPGK